MLHHPFRRVGRSTVWFVLSLAASVLVGCGGLETPNVPPSTRPSFGELVYRVLKSRMEASNTCSTEYVAALEANHSDFVTTFDYVIENGVSDGFPDLLGGTIKPFVDNDKLPRLVDTLASTLALLVSDEFDPNRETLQAMINLSETQSLLESSIAIQAVATILEDPTITDKIHTLAAIAQENDGVTYLMDDMFDVAGYALTSDATPSICTGIETPDAQSTLLRTAGFVENPALALGSPFYLARPDLHGNPQAAFYDGTIVAPFVDADADGAADVNAEGDPVDAYGVVIDIPMIGEDNAPGRDEYGRALDAQGRLVYDYYDTKRTALSYSTQLVADLVETGVHHQLPGVIDAVLGEPDVCADGDNCRQYPSATNVVADIVWLVFEIFEYTRTSVFQRTLTDGFTSDPATAERFLVAIGDVIRALDASPLEVTDTTLTRTIAGLVPLLSQILNASPTSGTPTARIAVEILDMLGDEAEELPANMNYLLSYQADAEDGNMATVDLSLPRYFMGDDNRSGMEQVVEMFEYADCGYVGSNGNVTQALMWTAFTTINGTIAGAPPLQPGTVSEVLVELVSHMQPGGVSNVVDLLDLMRSLAGDNTLADLFGSGVYLGNVRILPGLGCSDSDASQAVAHLDSLEVLIASSTLDWLLPVSKGFCDNGQRRTLVDIFAYIAFDLRRDEDNSPSTSSGFRKLGPVLIQLTTPTVQGDPYSTPFNRIFDALQVLMTIPASDGDGSALDVMFDAIGYMSTTRTVQTRPITGSTPGTVPNSSILAVLLEKVAVLQERVMAGGAAGNFSLMLDTLSPILTSTTGVGDARVLANPNLRLLIATYTDVLSQATDLPPDQYACYVADLQVESAEFFGTKHFATLIRILNHLVSSPNAAGLEEWIVSMLRGHEDRRLELYGRLSQLIAGGLSSNASSDDLSQLLDWLGASLDANGAGGMRELVATLDELLASDTNGSILVMLRSLLAPGPLASMERPINTYLDMASDIAAVDPDDMCMATGAEIDLADLNETIEGVSDFLTRDPNDGTNQGIEQIWQLVGSIAPEE